MSYLYKILRWSAWVLLLAMPVALISGFLALKPYLLPWFGAGTYRYIHLVLVPVVVTPIIYLHSVTGIISLMNRHAITRRKYLQIIAGLLWTAIFVWTIWLFVAPMPKLPVGQNSVVPAMPSSTTPLTLTLAEVAKHNSLNDCWMIISGKVYNLSGYFNAHPGGAQAILKYCGQDGSQGYATKDYGRSHSAYADSLLQNYYLGAVGETVNAAAAQKVVTPPAGFQNREDD